jgi:hypothetical protein
MTLFDYMHGVDHYASSKFGVDYVATLAEAFQQPVLSVILRGSFRCFSFPQNAFL